MSTNLLTELVILRDLMTSQVLLGQHNVACVVHVHRLTHTAQNFLLTATKPDASHTQLATWMVHFCEILVNKISFLFSNFFSERESRLVMSEKKPIMSLYFQKLIDEFMKDTDASNVSVLIDSKLAPHTHTKGYEFFHPQGSEQYEPPTGLKSWPCVFSSPSLISLEYLPSVVSLVLDNRSSLFQPLGFVDNRLGMACFLAELEPGVVMVVLYLQAASAKASRLLQRPLRKANDKQVLEFLVSFSSLMRNRRAFMKLKAQPSSSLSLPFF
eukprot:TRINITY_DN13835_c0_g1_i1.p1 TRINITY_DN13835_c0_g1~~TRINITY_DN13835_c0_g1_i1.p1  ORF type:complete len:270 (-),score=69.71 TRINITY_DN13835_c0_g1_i1:3-812(-)